MDKQRQILRILIAKSLFCLAVALLGWLVCSRLVHVSGTASFLLALIPLVLFDVKLFLSYSEIVRRRLLKLQNLEDDSLAAKRAVGLKTHFIVLFASIAVIQVMLFLVVPRIESFQSRQVAAGLLIMSVSLYLPVLQLISYNRLSHAVGVVVPTPLNFLSMLWPTWALSMVGSVFAFGGIYAVLVGKSPLYLVSGIGVATALFALANKTFQQIATKVQPVGPHPFGSSS